MNIYKSKNNYYYKILNNHKKIRISKTEFNKLQQKGAGASFSKGTSDQNSPKTYQHNELTKMKKYVDDEIQKLENQIKIKEDKLLETKIRLTARSRYGYRREINPEYPNTKPLRKKLEKEISLLTEELNFLNEKKNHLKVALFKINQADELKTVRKVLKDGLGETIAKNLGPILGDRIRLGMSEELSGESNRKNRPKKTNKRPRNNNNSKKNNNVQRVSQRSRVSNGSQR
jgi:hypothetical protein